MQNRTQWHCNPKMPEAGWEVETNYLDTQEPASLEYTGTETRKTLKKKEEVLLALTLEALDGIG